MISLFVFILLFYSIPSRSQQDNQSLDSRLIFNIYIAHGLDYIDRDQQKNSKLDHTKLYSNRSRYNQKNQTKKNGKDRSVMVIQYRGTSPKLGSCQGECPYPCDYVSFLGSGDEGVVDDVGLSSIFQGICSPSQTDDRVFGILRSAANSSS